MPVEPIPDMMRSALRSGYAVGYFESWNLESLQGVIDAAEQARSPVIVGVNGDFLTRDDRLGRERLAVYGAMCRAAAESASVPCGVIFNECPRDAWCIEAMSCGFNLVMPADPDAPLDDYTRRVAAIVGKAHARGVAVEAEIGHLPDGTSDNASERSETTDPAVAAQFARETGIDLLAVSIGNVHVKLRGNSQGLDLDRLAAIREQVGALPLVLHGGTGIDATSLKKAVALGVTKVNFGTYLKQRYLSAIERAVGRKHDNPHEMLGIGGDHDIMIASRQAVKNAVLERIHLLGCCGKG